MKTKDYYLRELNALRADGVDFAREHPGLSSFLAKEGQDPDVERVLEGFAFLTGRLHQRFDEELPEVSHSLTQLLWPNYLRSVPSYSIIKFNALRNDLKNISISKNTQVLSEKSVDGVTCKFKTCYNVNLMPLELADVRYTTDGQNSAIELDLSMTVKGSIADLSFETLRLFLSGSKFMSRELYLYLTQYISSIEISIQNDDSSELESLVLPRTSIKQVGFDAADTMLPYPNNIFDGYMILQEYFCYQDKYLFLDLCNLNEIEKISSTTLEQSNKLCLKVNLNKQFTTTQIPTKEDFELYTTPVINIFESDSVPIRKNQFEDEYLLAPSEVKRHQSEVFSILKVRGWVQSKNGYQDYAPFESFINMNENKEYYSERVKLNDSLNRTDTYLRFSSSQGMFENLEHNNAVISVKMLCTNKDVPSTLPLNAISIPDPSSYKLEFKNITIPSVSYPPPIHGDFLWRVISNMSLNYLSLENIETLVTMLKTYDFFGENDLKQKKKTEVMLSGLVAISSKKSEMIFEGFPIRGIETEIIVDSTKFICIGEIYLLGCVINEFLALYSSINSFHKFIMNIENHEVFEWVPRMGRRKVS